jgi:hypothetical protein
MSLSRWLFLLLLVLPVALVLGQERPAPTYAEIRTQLFGLNSPNPSVPSMLPQEVEEPAKKSVGLAALYSLLLPGMGEVYAGTFSSSGKYFLLAEGALWITYAAFEIYANSVQTDARTFAVAHAGVILAGKNDQFFVDIGNFPTVDEYNQKKLRDRQPEKVYDPTAGYGWAWDSDASRTTFEDQRIASDQMYNNEKFVVAAILVNHIASAINAGMSAVQHNSAIGKVLEDVRFGARVMGGPGNEHGALLTVQKGF